MTSYRLPLHIALPFGAGMVALGLLLSASLAFAQEAVTETTVAPTPPTAPAPLPPREQYRADMENIRTGKQEAAKTLRMDSREKAQGIRQDTRDARVTMMKNGSTSPENREAMKKEMEMRQEKLRALRASSTEKMKERRMEERARIARAHAEKTKERMLAAVERLEKFADRISSRLDKAEANKKNVAVLRTELAVARTKIAEAKTAVEGTSSVVTEVLAMGNPRDGMEKLRTAFHLAKEKIKDAHAALVDVVNSVKGLGKAADAEPVGTATTTTP